MSSRTPVKAPATSAKKPILIPRPARRQDFPQKGLRSGLHDDYPSKKEAAEKLQADIEKLANYQDMLYAQDTYALLLIFQAMDAAGKDGTIKHVMSGVNPQGCDVFSFKAPSSEELNHDYLWRAKRLPERGRIGIFNRSYYEEVLVVRVHPEILEAQQLPPEARGKDVWKAAFRGHQQLRAVPRPTTAS